jgi:hypothetical protein
MAARSVARRLSRLIFRASRVLLGIAAVGWTSPGCYSAGSGSNPPANIFYFPVGLAVSGGGNGGGNALYVVNSDFDLQWNGGTIQSYDLFIIRRHAAELVHANLTGTWLFPNTNPNGNPADPSIPFINPWQPNCTDSPPPTDFQTSSGMRIPLGQLCAPPVDSTKQIYFKDSATIGAFATTLLLPLNLSSTLPRSRFFTPVRGDGTVTWADVRPDLATDTPQGDSPPATKAGSPGADPAQSPFIFDCGQGTATTGSRCSASHQTGNNPNEMGNTRHLTMPGEPFAIALTEDDSAMVVTSQLAGQTNGESSLLLTGIQPVPIPTTTPPTRIGGPPSMQFVLDNVAPGSNGIAAVPHDSGAVPRCDDPQHPNVQGCVRPAFLETSHSAAEIDLLRYYNDLGSSLGRPFLVKERAYGFSTNVPGFDSRGIVIDPTPAMLCKQRLGSNPNPLDLQRCAQTPSRVFIANRTPQSVIFGTIGQLSRESGTYDPDALVLQGNVPVGQGPSQLYLAPIVDLSGHYALRLFVVCYDAAQIWVFNPDDITNLRQLAQAEVINTGLGPFAMAFDPFCVGLSSRSASNPPMTVTDPNCAANPFADVVTSELDEEMGSLQTGLVPIDSRQAPSLQLKRYRFAYAASFTNSYVQVIDLDGSLQLSPTATSFLGVAFTLGQPTVPKGS